MAALNKSQFRALLNHEPPQNICGSGGATIRLAREYGFPFNRDAGWSTAFASKSNRRTAAPTFRSVLLASTFRWRTNKLPRPFRHHASAPACNAGCAD
ncbi:hypothetical protein CUN63_21310 [Pseudomonas sp. ACM7]|nr:hypothetical protein CUN63_21310 [Pseudomonas sp. ACM7]